MKAILLVRVSTLQQDFTEQENEIYQMAINDGYKPSDIIPICEKESGIKLDETERAGLNKMKELVESNIGVNCVYCWEVSRIARRKKINFSVLEYLTNHKVQLVIKNPSIRLFNSDGSINEGAEVVFTLYSQMAESEMRTKKERFKRSKTALLKQGHYIGGFIAYGYEVDNNKKIVPKPSEVEVVAKIYTMYLSGEYSIRSLTKELQSIGIFTDKSFTTAFQQVRSILQNKRYAGDSFYPALVTKDMMNKVREICNTHIVQPKKVFKNIYFGKGLIRCPECGKIMMAFKKQHHYACNYCNKASITINIMDSVLWYYAKMLYKEKMTMYNEDKQNEFEAKISNLSTKISVAEDNINSIKERVEKIEYRAYVEGTMNIDKAVKFTAELNSKIEALNKSINTYKNDLQSTNNMLIQVRGNYYGDYIDDLGEPSDKTKYDIIHDVILMSTINRIARFKVVLTIVDYLDKEVKFLLDTKHHKIFSTFTHDFQGIDEIKDIYNKRIIKGNE